MSTITFDANFDNLDEIRAFVGKAARQAGFSDKEIYSIQLAADEASSNIIEHAYAGVGNGKIEIDCRTSETELTIVMRDDGKSFNPSSVPEPNVKADLSDRKIGGLDERWPWGLLRVPARRTPRPRRDTRSRPARRSNVPVRCRRPDRGVVDRVRRRDPPGERARRAWGQSRKPGKQRGVSVRLPVRCHGTVRYRYGATTGIPVRPCNSAVRQSRHAGGPRGAIRIRPVAGRKRRDYVAPEVSTCIPRSLMPSSSQRCSRPAACAASANSRGSNIASSWRSVKCRTPSSGVATR